LKEVVNKKSFPLCHNNCQNLSGVVWPLQRGAIFNIFRKAGPKFEVTPLGKHFQYLAKAHNLKLRPLVFDMDARR